MNTNIRKGGTMTLAALKVIHCIQKLLQECVSIIPQVLPTGDGIWLIRN
ncbi:hypothetical protein HDE68_005108 [Pedobacter cryoconitis]|uniref:Uncharacterized protein n=1 Tax=Pedobacter cryoconitis TaxID=188932 RepID=A0A7W8ZSQ2_9SPHI|nr:hypothetical protein [Pedobacter cryoconitis]MBB5639167.1 hypothetical protein [Pedobacter cryoconitis]